jgi:hypothetical protein
VYFSLAAHNYYLREVRNENEDSPYAFSTAQTRRRAPAHAANFASQPRQRTHRRRSSSRAPLATTRRKSGTGSMPIMR